MTTPYDQDGLHTADPFTMRTFTGKLVDPFRLMPSDISLVDMAHSLSRQCRYNGHSYGHLSVARHSINVHDWVQRHGGTDDEAFAGLLHDGAEAYIGDLIRPLKARPEFEFFRQLDDTITAVILVASQLEFTSLPEIVHLADNEITKAEVTLARHEYDGNAKEDKDIFYRLGHFHLLRLHENRTKA